MTTNTQHTLVTGLIHTFNESFDGLMHTGRDIQCEIFDKGSSWTAVTWKNKKNDRKKILQSRPRGSKV